MRFTPAFLSPVILAIGISSFTSHRGLDKWFRYDGKSNSASQVLDPAKYSDLNGQVPSNPGDVDCILAYIHVDSATEVHTPGGTNAGKPKVDVQCAIQSELNTYVVGKICPTEVPNRITIR